MAGEILPRHYIYGIIMFTLVIVGGLTLLGDFINESPEIAEDSKYTEFSEALDVQDDILATTEDMRSDIESYDATEFGVFGVLNALINSAWNTLKLLLNSLDFMASAITGGAIVFDIPTWIPTLIIALVTILVVFSIYSAIFQRDI
jgi:hypothetical protein